MSDPTTPRTERSDFQETSDSVAETRAFALKALERRMKIIGLMQTA